LLGFGLKFLPMRYYNKFSDYLKRIFGVKVWKVSVDAGFKCPPQAKCIYCFNLSFTPSYARRVKEIELQIKEGIEIIRKSKKAKKFIVYFQPYTNTYGDPETLEFLYFKALRSHPDIVGISIGTRADCITDEVMEVLKELKKKTFLWVELGLQSALDKTLEITKRGEKVEDFEKAVSMLKREDIKVITHVIIGLPGEKEEDFISTANFLNRLKIEGVKIHPLHVVKNTELEDWFKRGKYKPLEFEEYVKYVVDFLEVLDPEIVIARLTGETQKDLLIAPVWCENKMRVLNRIEEEFKMRNSFQGKRFTEC